MTQFASGIRAIETRYSGCRFRSRLEARYAVLFNALRLRWDYEAEGYQTADGWYLPDFVLHLPNKDVLFEVKPESEMGSSDPRWWGASVATGLSLIVAYGMPKPDHLGPDHQPGDGQYILVEGDGLWDTSYAFCSCPWCGKVGIEYGGRGARVCGYKAHGLREGEVPFHVDKAYSFDDPHLVNAYTIALSARFEHREPDPDPFASGFIRTSR